MNAANFVRIRDIKFKILLGLLLTVIMTLGITMTASAGISINTGELWANGWKIDVQLTSSNGGDKAVFTTNWGTFSPSGYSGSTNIYNNGQTASVSCSQNGNAHINLSGYTRASGNYAHITGWFTNDNTQYTTQMEVNVPAVALEMHDPVPQSVDLGVPSTIKVTVYHYGLEAGSGEPVHFQINNGIGRWSDESSFNIDPTTNVYGIATATISSFTPGTADIHAYADSDRSVQCQTEVIFGGGFGNGGGGGHGDHYPPLAYNDSYSVTRDKTLTKPAPGVLGNDVVTYGYSPLRAQLISNPSHGAVNLNGDGSFTYTPNKDYQGKDSFTYRALDKNAYGSNEAVVNITVEPIKVKVTYDPGDGSVWPGSQIKVFGSTYGKGVNGTNEAMPKAGYRGYSFIGWFTDKDSGTEVTDDTPVTNPSDHTLYARWTPIKVTVTYDTQGGNLIPPDASPQTKLYGSTYGKGEDGIKDDPMPVAQKTGCTFLGWYYKVLPTLMRTSVAAEQSYWGEHLVTNDTIVEPSYPYDQVCLYAKWKAPGDVLVTYDAQGGTVEPGTQIKHVGMNYGFPDRIPLAFKYGYDFWGWWTGENGTGSLITDATQVTNPKDHTLYARWEPPEQQVIIVTYDAKGGTIEGIDGNTQTKYVGCSYSYPDRMPGTEKDGYDFDGWWTEDGSGTEITDDTIVTDQPNHEITLYARWESPQPPPPMQQITVTYDVKGGTIEGIEGNTQVKYVTCPYSYPESMPWALKDGDTFNGWWTEDGSGTWVNDDTIVTNSKDHTLYARWEHPDDIFTVAYDGNDAEGSVPVDDRNYHEGDSVTVKDATGLSKADCTFEGWKSSIDGKIYHPDDSFTMGTANVILTAQWTGNDTTTYTVTYAVGAGAEGSVPVDDRNYHEGDSVTVKDAAGLSKAGCTFEGWKSSIDGKIYHPDDSFTMGTANVTLTAQWSGNQPVYWTVTFYSQGGDPDVNSVQVKDGDTVAQPADPVRSGYKFAGWYTEKDNYTDETRFDFQGTPITNNTDLYGNWSQNNPGGESFPIFSALPSFFELFGD